MEELLSNPETYADGDLIRDCSRQFSLVNQDLTAAFAEWEHLMELIELQDKA